MGRLQHHCWTALPVEVKNSGFFMATPRWESSIYEQKPAFWEGIRDLGIGAFHMYLNQERNLIAFNDPWAVEAMQTAIDLGFDWLVTLPIDVLEGKELAGHENAFKVPSMNNDGTLDSISGIGPDTGKSTPEQLDAWSRWTEWWVTHHGDKVRWWEIAMNPIPIPHLVQLPIKQLLNVPPQILQLSHLMQQCSPEVSLTDFCPPATMPI